MKQNIFFLLSICIVLFSCSGDNDDPIKEIEKPPVETTDPFITLKKSNVDFSNEGGSEAIVIESNVAWTAKSSEGWCTVSPASGNKSTASIKISAPANEDYDDRSCTVTLEGGGITKTITVNQGESLGLLITQDRYELGNEESTIKVEVKANVEFEVKINDEWITQVETRGLTTSEIEFNIAENDTYSNREGSITIKQKDGDMESTITIFQSQEDALILSEKDFELTSEAQSVEVELKTNIDYEIIIPEEAKSWVTYSSNVSSRGLETKSVTFDISENEGYDTRITKIYIKNIEKEIEYALTISQRGMDKILLTVYMPIIGPMPRVSIEDFYSSNTWQAGDELSFAFVKEGETTINVKATEKTISTYSTKAQFELELPEGFKDGSFELYGVYNGGGELNGTKVAYPTSLNDAKSDKELRKREMLYFKTTLNVSHNKQFSVELERTISALKVSFENGGSVTIGDIKEMRFVSKANIKWAYDLYDKNNIWDLMLGEFQNFETSANSISLKADKSSLVSGETIDYWGWYFPAKNIEVPDLEVQFVKSDGAIIPLTEFKAGTFLPYGFYAGILYSYRFKYNSDIP